MLSYLIDKLFNLHLSLKYDHVIIYVQFKSALKRKTFATIFVSIAICAVKLIFISIFIPFKYNVIYLFPQLSKYFGSNSL